MTRGVAEVLALYLDSPESLRPPVGESARGGAPPKEGESPGSGASLPGVAGPEPSALWVPIDGMGLVERFVVWNLGRALVALGRHLRLVPSRGSTATPALLLLHASDTGLCQAERRLAAIAIEPATEVVVFGEAGRSESGTWVRRLGERATERRGRLLHRGGVDTGHSLARSILRREAIIDHPKAATREQWMTVAAGLGGGPDTPGEGAG